MTSPFALPPGPPPVTFAPWSIGSYARKMRAGAAAIVGERFAKYGRLYYAPFLGRPVYVLSDPADVQQVLVTQASKFAKPEDGVTARQLRMLLGEGLLNSNGEPWRRQRRLVQPAFKREHLERYAEMTTAQTAKVERRWRDGVAIDVSAEMMGLTLAIVSEALFSHEVSGDTDRVVQIMKTFRGAFGGVQALLPSWLPTAGRRQTLQAIADMDAFVYGLIDSRKDGARDDLLGVLVRAVDTDGDGSGMDRQLLRDELLTLFIAGHETTSHALSWTWYLLSQHPAVEQKLHAELDTVLGGRVPNYADLDALVYTGQVLEDAMRLFPPDYALARVGTEDVRVAGYTLPRGADVVIWIYHVHRDAAVYPNPERFDPERFAPGTQRTRPPCAYIPFGAGSRTCVGKHFAIMEAKLILAQLASRVRVRIDPQYTLARDMAVTLAPRGPLPATVTLRAGLSK